MTDDFEAVVSFGLVVELTQLDEMTQPMTLLPLHETSPISATRATYEDPRKGSSVISLISHSAVVSDGWSSSPDARRRRGLRHLNTPAVSSQVACTYKALRRAKRFEQLGGLLLIARNRRHAVNKVSAA